MNIEIVKRISSSELFDRLRKVPLTGTDTLVYANADISIKELHPDHVNPTTFYLLKNGIEFQRKLRDSLLDKYGIDTLKLDGALEIIVDNSGEIWTLTPPIIEVTGREVRYVAKEGDIEYGETSTVQIPIINDGAHRVNLAREIGKRFNGIYISGALMNFPFYAHPNSWDRVKVVDEVPSSKEEKKFYLREDCYALYRDFGVLGCGKPRRLGDGKG